jgi:hypothetical protein
VAGLRWYLARRPATAETALLVSTNRKALTARSKNGSTPNNIRAEMVATLRKAEKVSPGFRRLSFNKFRKTAGNLIKAASDGETMAVFHSRGHTVRTDTLSSG